MSCGLMSGDFSSCSDMIGCARYIRPVAVPIPEGCIQLCYLQDSRDGRLQQPLPALTDRSSSRTKKGKL